MAAASVASRTDEPLEVGGRLLLKADQEPLLERSGSCEAETFRKCFRQFSYEQVTGPHEAFSKLWELCCRWLKPETRSKEQILELLVIEQFLTILPKKIQAWAQRQCPESGEEAVALVICLEKETGRRRQQMTVSGSGFDDEKEGEGWAGRPQQNERTSSLQREK